MDWSKGFTAAYYAYIVDPATWRETERMQITGGSVTRDGEGLRQSADIDCTEYDTGTEQWLRVYMDTEQAGAAAHVPVFTGLASAPERKINGVRLELSLECYSVLKPAQDVLLPRGYYVAAGTDGAQAITDLLAVTPAPVEAEDGAPVINGAIIAEDGETRLSMADKVLDAMGWRLQIAGDGTIMLSPRPLDPVVSFDPLDNDAIEPELTITRDWYECPNVFRVVYGDVSAEARDDDPDSPLSTVSRGREVWAEETDAELSDGETVAECAARMLHDAQRVAVTASYSRRFHPDVNIGDLVRLHYPAQGLDGDYTVTEQKITLEYGAATEEGVTA